MSYFKDKEDLNNIEQTSKKAFALMTKNNVPATPSNYHIWYSYTAEENMALNNTIDEMLKKGKPFTPTVCYNIYDRFFSNIQEQNAVINMGQNLQTELAVIAKTVCDINKGSVKYGATLIDSLNDLDKILGGTELKTIISSLLVETKEIADTNNVAQLQLKESAKTVQILQATLEAVRQESLTDMLTNIGNRKSFEENLNNDIKKAVNDDGDLCLILGDIDHFKKFNDTWGHHVGDQVLKAVAYSMKTKISDMGSVARYGGEEFAILLSDISLEKALEISEEIRLSIANRTMKRKSTGESIGKISCSFGIAKYRKNEHRNDFLERADAALYRSKSNGRNRITLESDKSHNVLKIA
ncbi:MAG: GGDEF domain-containing protein [Emcibacter sp.]|nr:GGDEF domain-containing protein [Emcibacter sp.]